MSELFPLLCARAAADGGLGLQPSEVGEALIPLSVTLLCTPLLYPVVERRVGHYGCFRIGSMTVTCAVVLMSSLPSLRDVSPAVAPARSSNPCHQKDTAEIKPSLPAFGSACLHPRRWQLMWVGLCGVGVLRGITGPLIFSSLMVIFNDMVRNARSKHTFM